MQKVKISKTTDQLAGAIAEKRGQTKESVIKKAILSYIASHKGMR